MPVERFGGKGLGALHSGSVRKLAYLVGLFGGWCLANRVEWVTVEPMQWKGNVPKEITKRRLLRTFPELEEERDHNIVDAVGIAWWYIRWCKSAKK